MAGIRVWRSTTWVSWSYIELRPQEPLKHEQPIATNSAGDMTLCRSTGLTLKKHSKAAVQVSSYTLLVILFDSTPPKGPSGPGDLLAFGRASRESANPCMLLVLHVFLVFCTTCRYQPSPHHSFQVTHAEFRQQTSGAPLAIGPLNYGVQEYAGGVISARESAFGYSPSICTIREFTPNALSHSGCERIQQHRRQSPVRVLRSR